MEPYRKHAKEHRRGGGDIAGVTVEETDGSPSVKNVTKIKVAVGDLTDNADGSVTIATGGAAGGAHALTDVNNTVSGRTAGDILVAAAATTYAFRQLSGDVAMNGTGVVTVAATHSGSTHRAQSSTTPSAVGPAAVGTGATDARSDHVHNATFTRTIVVESPTAAENLGIGAFVDGYTITKVRAVLVGSATPSVTWNLKYATDRSAAGTLVWTVGKTTTGVTTGDTFTAFDNAAITADAWLWFLTTAKSGTVTQIEVTIEYRRT